MYLAYIANSSELFNILKMINLESPLSTISRGCRSDVIAVGGKSLMRIYQLENKDNINTFKLLKTLKTARSSSKVGTTDLAWNNILENILASTTILNSEVLVWDVNQVNLAKLNTKVGSHSQLISRVNWSHHNADILASCSMDGYLNIWDRKLRVDEPALSMHHRDKIRDCQFNPFFESYIIASYISGAVKLWDIRNPRTFVKEFIQHETDVLSIDWHPKLTNIFASGSMDKNLMIWDINRDNAIQTYKTSHGTSRVKWWKKNPQYILSAYRTDNFYTSMWNINIDNMPEYIYKGHKDVVTGFCCDMTESKLITCSKDNYMIMANFEDGMSCIDNVCTNFCEFKEDDMLYIYKDKKPPKTVKSIIKLGL
jgi:WD40 repeat protein